MDNEFEDYDMPPESLKILIEAYPSCLNSLQREIRTQVTDKQINEYIHVMEQTISKFYVDRDGRNWSKDKHKEMKTKGLVFVGYRDQETNKLVSFMSMLLTTDDWGLVIYLYEIHVLPQFHGMNIGGSLMECLHDFSERLKPSGIKLHNAELSNLTSTKLTVFPKNEKAVNWYTKMGYFHSKESPTDRVLRSGKVLKPEYYILYRLL